MLWHEGPFNPENASPDLVLAHIVRGFGRAELGLDGALSMALRHLSAKGWCTSGDMSPPSSSLTAHQESLLDAAGVPESMRSYIGLYGARDAQVAIGVWNYLRLGPYWPELRHTPRLFEISIWKLQSVQVSGHEGEPVFAHSSMMDLGRPDRDPDKVISVDAQDDSDELGIQLACAVWRWGTTAGGWAS